MDIFNKLHGHHRIGVKKWQHVLGELQFMAPAVPGSAGLFGTLQLGLSHADKHQVKITWNLHEHLDNFKALAHDMSQEPTCLAEVMPDYPLVIGSIDTTKPGMGSVLFALGHPPTLWCTTFPADIQQHIISIDNPSGDLTNSDLKQASVLALADVAASLYNLCKFTLATLLFSPGNWKLVTHEIASFQRKYIFTNSLHM